MAPSNTLRRRSWSTCCAARKSHAARDEFDATRRPRPQRASTVLRHLRRPPVRGRRDAAPHRRPARAARARDRRRARLGRPRPPRAAVHRRPAGAAARAARRRDRDARADADRPRAHAAPAGRGAQRGRQDRRPADASRTRASRRPASAATTASSARAQALLPAPALPLVDEAVLAAGGRPAGTSAKLDLRARPRRARHRGRHHRLRPPARGDRGEPARDARGRRQRVPARPARRGPPHALAPAPVQVDLPGPPAALPRRVQADPAGHRRPARPRRVPARLRRPAGVAAGGDAGRSGPAARPCSSTGARRR